MSINYAAVLVGNIYIYKKVVIINLYWQLYWLGISFNIKSIGNAHIEPNWAKSSDLI